VRESKGREGKKQKKCHEQQISSSLFTRATQAWRGCRALFNAALKSSA